MPLSTELRQALAPTGALRASINVGNPILARLPAHRDTPEGVSVDLAQTLATALGVPLQLIVAPNAAQSVANLESGQADVGFFAIDPARGAHLHFTPPYALIEGVYLVRRDSPLQRADEVDQPATRVAVSQGSAYDLYLSRTLKQAHLVRLPSAGGVVQGFLDQQLEVAAGIRQPMAQAAAANPDLRLLPQPFMVIRQAMGLATERGALAAQYLDAFVRQQRDQGGVHAALQRHQIDGVEVAHQGD